MGASLMNSTISLDDIYPVGSIYMNINSTNPANLFGGVWKQIKERFILGCGDTHTAGSTGGEFEHTLKIDEIPPHAHPQTKIFPNGQVGTIVIENSEGEYSGDTRPEGQNKWLTNKRPVSTWNMGGGQPHNNTPLFGSVHLATNSIIILRGRYHE